MIGMRDALTLAHTKIRSKRLRLIITTIVSGLVFGVMAGATILVDGMSKSLTEFARQNLDGRFLVSGTPNYYGPVDFNPSDATLIAEVQKYVPGYKLVNGPVFDGKRVSVFLEVEGLGDYLPKYAGNLDIMTAAAARTAEMFAEEMLAGTLKLQ